MVRPLAVVMVADANPITLTNLRQLSQWADLALLEGTRTTGGDRREPLRGGWRDVLCLDRERCRVATTELPPGGTKAQRSHLQRSAVVPLLVREVPDRPVLLLDTDEFLDPRAVASVLRNPPQGPVRLGLVPLFGAIDRSALSMHCCWRPGISRLRDSTRPFVFPGPSLSTARSVVENDHTQTRFGSPLIDGIRVFGTHLTLTETPDRVNWKLRNSRHTWSERVLDPAHLQVMLDAGVHPAGWWISQYREPEPWLVALATDAGLRVCGPMRPSTDLQALRAWAEARNDPALPDGFVRLIDHYVRVRPPGTKDFLNEVATELLARPMRQIGQPDRASSDGIGMNELALR